MSRDMFDLSGKVAFVTAGGSGIGRAFCQAMAEFGANVVCNDVSERAARETVSLLETNGGHYFAAPGDMSDPKSVETAVARCLDRFGVLDIAFLNAGFGTFGHRIHEIPVATDWDPIMNLNLRGTFIVMQEVLKAMLPRKRGSIICTASIGGLWAGAMAPDRNINTLTPYCVSKAAVIHLTRMAASEYGADGIRVNAIAPGFTHTPATNPTRDMVDAMMLPAVPLGRLGEPEDLKGVAVWLASDASSWVTGQTIVVDGGITL